MGTAIGDVIYLNKKFKERYPEMEPVFKYETINGMHRKRDNEANTVIRHYWSYQFHDI